MKVFAFVLLIFINLSGYSQAEVIKWDKGIKIKWDDFKGKADINSPFAAMSAIGLHYKYTSWSNKKVYKINFQVYSSFNKIKSWSKGRLRTEWMLRHEQLHFDIGGLVSREFKKEAERRSYGKNYKNEIRRIFNRYTLNLQKLQQKYDEQTQHSENKMKQKEWENLVHQELLK
jgi:hypothetical protein